jgi:Flp pilus assembly protein TadG
MGGANPHQQPIPARERDALAGGGATPTSLRRGGSRMIRRLRRDRSGVTAVEFAIVALLLMTWIFGMIEVARAYWAYQIIQEVAIEQARCMGVVASGCASAGAYSNSAAVTNAITIASNRGLTITGSNVTLTRPATCAAVSGFSQATISYTFTTTVPLLLASLSTANLTASACFFNTR